MRPALAGRLIETDERVERRGASEFWFPGAKKASQLAFVIGDGDLLKM